MEPWGSLRIPFGKIGVHLTGKIRGITTRDPVENPITTKNRTSILLATGARVIPGCLLDDPREKY